MIVIYRGADGEPLKDRLVLPYNATFLPDQPNLLTLGELISRELMGDTAPDGDRPLTITADITFRGQTRLGFPTSWKLSVPIIISYQEQT